ERIGRLLRDPAEFGRCSQAARAAVVAHNAVESVAGRWCDLIESVCGPDSVRRGGARPKVSRLKLWEAMPWGVKRIVTPVVSRIPPRFVLGRRFRSTLEFVHDAERWPAARAAEYQLKRLQAICTLAYQKSRY